MNTALVLLCVLAISVGQVLFKLAAARLAAPAGGFQPAALLFNPPLLAALALYGGATLLWVWLLRDRSLSGAYPLFALSFVFVAGLSRVVLGEPLTLSVALGTALVVSGVVVMTSLS